MSDSSYRTILRSSSIIGGAQVINIGVSLVKMKAVLLSPAGVGLAGLNMNLVQTASTVSALGFGNVGTRQIATAQAEGGDMAVGRTRRAPFWGTMGLALFGAAVFWVLNGWIARFVLDDPSRANEVAWLSLAVAPTVEAVALQSDPGGAVAGLLLGGTLGIWALMQLLARTGEGGPLGRIAAVGERMKRWMGVRF